MKYLKIVKLIEIESGIVVTRGWGEWVVRDSYIMDVSVQILCGKTDNSTSTFKQTREQPVLNFK